MNFLMHSCCERGGREKNEDAVLIKQNNDTFSLIVADGLGGHQNGELASHLAVEFLTEQFFSNPSLQQKSLEDLFLRADNAVCSLHTANKKMKSTVAGLFYHQGNMVGAYLGDTRIYHFKDGKILFYSEDHSVSQMAVYAKEITREEIRFHIDRNKVLRALGGNCKVEVIPMPDLEKGDVYLICTDGFWEYITEEMMEIELVNSPNPKQWLEKMCGVLKKEQDVGHDNYSAIAIFCMEDKE